MNKVELTIFTPTYNRANTLQRLYGSLKIQTLKNFEWLIIDDGSIDNTEEIVDQFIKDNIISIRYIKQENAGKQAAWNNAVMNAKGKFFCGVDSDDALAKADNIENIFNKYLYLLEDKEIIGLRFLAYSNVKNTFDGRKISDEILIQSYFEEFSDRRNFGERIDVFKIELLKKYLYPVNPSIKFIPEIWFYVKVSADDYKFAYIPEPLRLFFDNDTENRLSKSSILKNAQGHYVSRSVMLKLIPWNIFLKNFVALIKTIIRYGQCSDYLKVNLRTRIKDTNLTYALLSYFSKLIKFGI
ncbi:glycosyltransferase family 2 protein [Acinetobacter lanii]|uniref:Glycosyltransferase family 2 protein n=1 Tax=Acinetobacter lanii TaxID=2715163 RepID=A0A6G8S805_9GAMM|nr:glycosyltransferase family 2 protein [Acinetobacter lanii]QIO10188.1 glycosyltransferase family 2 protein [Acinetobacter lanii]